MPYVKLQISVPGGKVISNVAFYIEYKSTDVAAPAEIPVTNGSIVTKILDSHYDAKYHVKNINLDSISNPNEVVIQIRGAREDVWTDWKDITFDAGQHMLSDIVFDNYRFFQLKVQLRSKDASVKINSIDLEVIK
jgi:hypothetical protein